MLKRLIIFLFASLLLNTAIAGALDFSLSNESAQIVYLFDNTPQIGVGGADMGAGIFFNEQDDLLAHFAFMVTGHATRGDRGFQFGGGAKAYIGKLEDAADEDRVSAIAIGGTVGYIFPGRVPLGLSLEGFYAPNITSFSDNKDMRELSFRFDIEVAPTVQLYLGYRWLETELEDSRTDYELDDAAHLGVRFSF